MSRARAALVAVSILVIAAAPARAQEHGAKVVDDRG
jgi:hypothetical protein